MEKKKLNAIYEKDIKEFLKSIGILQDIENKKVKCNFCGEVITIDNIAAVYPENNEVSVCCDKLDCYEQLKSKLK